MRTIAHEKIGLLDHVEIDGQAVTAVMTMMIDDAGTDGEAVGPMKRMIVVMTTLTTKIDVAIANADVVKDHPQKDRRADRQADLQVGHQADHLQEDLTTRDQTAYIWSYPSVIAITTDLVILTRPRRIAVGLSWI